MNGHWFIFHNILIGMTTFVLLFKIHSYSAVNFELRERFLKGDLKSSKDPAIYPNNITFMNFAQYMTLPTFIYQTKYNLTSKRRISYLLLKAVLFIFSFVKGYQIITNYIMVYIEEYRQEQITFFELYLRELLPIPILVLMLIMMVFDFFCTFVAEATGYPDHQIYEDYWNSTTMNEFLSKLNCILSNFFRYHIAYKLMNKLNISLQKARTISFAFSTMALELLFVII